MLTTCPTVSSTRCIVATIDQVARRGGGALSLNFAVIREVLDPDRVRPVGRGHPPVAPADVRSAPRLRRSHASTRSSGHRWVPRYVVLDAPEFVATQGLVMAGVEGITEIPVIGRFLGAG